MTWSRGCGEERAYVCECVGSWLCHSARMCQSVLHVPVGGEREESVKPSARSGGGHHRHSTPPCIHPAGHTRPQIPCLWSAGSQAGRMSPSAAQRP